MHRVLTLRLIACVCLVGYLACSSAQAESIRIMVGGIEKQIYLPVALAERLGYFREQGLEVQLLSETSGVNAEDELLAGAVQGVVGFYDHTIDLQAKGKYAQSVVQFSRAPGEALLASKLSLPAIQSPANFRDRTVGVTGMGSSTHRLTQFLAGINGVKISELRFMAVGSGAGFIEAMERGRIDAGMTTEPTVSRLLESGSAKLLVDLRTPQTTTEAIRGPYPGACLYMTTLWINTHKSQSQRLANALVKALKYIHVNSAEAIAAQLPPAYYLGNARSYAEALRDSKSMFTADGQMPEAGPATVLRVLRQVDRAVAGKTIDLSRTFSTEFVSAAH